MRSFSVLIWLCTVFEVKVSPWQSSSWISARVEFLCVCVCVCVWREGRGGGGYRRRRGHVRASDKLRPERFACVRPLSVLWQSSMETRQRDEKRPLCWTRGPVALAVWIIFICCQYRELQSVFLTQTRHCMVLKRCVARCGLCVVTDVRVSVGAGAEMPNTRCACLNYRPYNIKQPVTENEWFLIFLVSFCLRCSFYYFTERIRFSSSITSQYLREQTQC